MSVLVEGQSQTRSSPDPNRPVAVFVLDIAGDGFQFTSPLDGVMFDIDGTGERSRIGWTRADAEDGFLFLDTNGNNVVDSGRELVGNGWRRPDGSRVASGDDALLVIQGMAKRVPGPVPRDLQHFGVVDSTDEVFGRLRFWRDSDHNGRSEISELKPLATLQILRVELGFEMLSGTSDAHGNTSVIEGSFYVSHMGEEARRRLVEVRFARARRP